MPRMLTPSLALSLAAATALAGTLVAGPRRHRRKRPERGPDLTDFGYRADVYGVKLVTDNVEAFNVKDAHAQLRCTRAVGQSAGSRRRERAGQPAHPRRGQHEPHRHLPGRQPHGVRGVNTIGDIRIGGRSAASRRRAW